MMLKRNQEQLNLFDSPQTTYQQGLQSVRQQTLLGSDYQNFIALVRHTLLSKTAEAPMLEIYFNDPILLNRLENWAKEKKADHSLFIRIKNLKKLMFSLPSKDKCSKNNHIQMTTLFDRKFNAESKLLCGNLNCDCHQSVSTKATKIDFAPYGYAPFKSGKKDLENFINYYKHQYGFPKKFEANTYLDLILKKISQTALATH